MAKVKLIPVSPSLQLCNINMLFISKIHTTSTVLTEVWEMDSTLGAKGGGYWQFEHGTKSQDLPGCMAMGVHF